MAKSATTANEVKPKCRAATNTETKEENLLTFRRTPADRDLHQDLLAFTASP